MWRFVVMTLAWSALATSRGEWCAVTTSPTVSATMANAARAMVATSPHVDFRGAYDGFDLVIVNASHPHPAVSATNLSCFEAHRRGDDGLWVIEAASRKQAAELASAVEKAGLEIKYRSKSGMAFVATGAEKLTEIKSLEECGETRGLSVIPVPSHKVPLDLLKVGPAFALTHIIGKADPVVQAAVDAVTQEKLLSSANDLAGFGTRNSYSTKGGIMEAADYLAKSAESLGLKATTFKFRDDMGPVVVAEKKGVSKEIVAVGAHYDSRNRVSSDATGKAPGADDNGSGSSAVLEAMRVLSEYDSERTLRFMWFSGEEQGLLGSRALAAAYAADGENVVAMVNADMLGYRLPNQPVVLGLMDRSVSQELTSFAINTTATYVGIATGYTSGCCSDQQSFYENGFPSVGFFENNASAVLYPQYHTADDVVKLIDMEQLTLETKAVVATIASVAGLSKKQQVVSV